MVFSSFGPFEARLQSSNPTLAQNKNHHQKPSILQPKKGAKYSASRLPNARKSNPFVRNPEIVIVKEKGKMVKSKKSEASNSNRENPDVLERKRLKKLAITNDLVSDAQVKAPYSLNPSKTVAKHHGKDIIRKSQRKNRFLFSFPGLLGPINGGGKIGELKDLSSKNPVLYLDFPQGQMKLFGTILYPKNRYLTLQFSRNGKNVMCEDYFDHMIIFSEAWWIGTKEDNPEELKLDFPKELFEGKGVECDFKGGAGAGSVNKQVVQKSGGTKYVKEESPETELDDDLSDDNNDFKDLKETTPIRQSARTSGKKIKFTEVSSGDDSAERSPDALGMEEEEVKKVKTNTSSGIIPDIESESSREGNQSREGNKLSEQIQAPVTKSKKLSESSVSVTIPKENSYNSHGSLVQPTISTLFKKVQEKKKAEEKGAPRNSRKSSSSKVPDQKLKKTDLKTKIDPVEAPTKRGTVTEEKKAGTGTKTKKKVNEVEDDDIEEFSSSSQGTEGSDGDWEA